MKSFSSAISALIITSGLASAASAAQAGYYGDNGHGKAVFVAEIVIPAQQNDAGAVHLCYRNEEGKQPAFGAGCGWYVVSAEEMSKLGVPANQQRASASPASSNQIANNANLDSNGQPWNCFTDHQTCDLPQGMSPNHSFRLVSCSGNMCHWQNTQFDVAPLTINTPYYGCSFDCGYVNSFYYEPRFHRGFPERCFNGTCEVLVRGGYVPYSRAAREIGGAALIGLGAVLALSH